MTTMLATPSLDRYRTAHKIVPLPATDTAWRCATDGVRVYRVLTQRWQHDQTELRKLQRLEFQKALTESYGGADPCFICHSMEPIDLGLYTRVTLGTGVVSLCDDCRANES